MSIKKKLYATFAIIIAFLIAITVYSSTQMSKIVDNYTYLIDDRAHKVVQASTIENATSLQGLYLRSYVLQQKQDDLNEVFAQIDVANETLAAIEPMFKTEKMIAEINTYKEKATAYASIIEQVETAVQKGELDAATALVFNEAVPVNRDMRTAIRNIIDFQTQQMNITNEDSQHTAATSKLWLMIAATIITIAAIIMGVFITLNITRPLQSLTQAANTIATGDLRVEDVDVQTKDEVAHLAVAFNKMKHNLKSVLESVSANVTNTTAATEQLSASTDEVTIATKEIAERMEEIAADSIHAAKMGTDCAVATDESAHGVHRIAEAAQHLQERAFTMQDLAATGEQTIQTTEQQMDVIQQASNITKQKIHQLSVQSAEIENISKVITAITEQTNLLALNAAIEAARAGEYGKGFAVVADEVRKLAEESKHSATKIGELTTLIQQDTKEVELSVNDTVNNVDKGVHYLHQAQSSFTTIVESISSMTAQIQEVSAAAEEVSASTEQVSTSVQTMSQTVDTSATKSEVILAAAEEQTATMSEINSVAKALNDGAVTLHEEISRFKL